MDFDMEKIYSSVLIEEKPATDKQVWKACKQIARNYPAIAYKHTHQSNRKGGFYRPHAHLVVAVPDNKELLWLNGLQDELNRVDKYGIFRMAKAKPEVVRNLFRLLSYLIGDVRQHTPMLVYQSPSWNRFEQEFLSSCTRAW